VKPRASQVLVILLLSMLAAPITLAQVTTEQLQNEGRLTLEASLRPAQDIIAGQKIKLVLQVATDRWFSGGTRIVVPEVPGLVILQTEPFAANASENRGGQSWVIQRWTLDVYPQSAGSFTIPPLRVQVSVNDEGNAVSGEIVSQPLQFKADTPGGLAAGQFWVAAPRYSVTQRFDRKLGELNVGDAFEREILFEASDLMAMMLPAFEPVEQPGFSAYSLPPTLDNNNNRGVSTATRIERISYVLEAPGTYVLAAQDYHWLNTRSGELQLITLPAVEFTVAGQAADQPLTKRHQLRLQPMQLAWIFALLLIALVLWKTVPSIPAANIVRQLKKGMAQLAARWRELRKPGLPSSLNPGSSAGD
jgi:BatD DUF11 like domain